MPPSLRMLTSSVSRSQTAGITACETTTYTRTPPLGSVSVYTPPEKKGAELYTHTHTHTHRKQGALSGFRSEARATKENDSAAWPREGEEEQERGDEERTRAEADQRHTEEPGEYEPQRHLCEVVVRGAKIGLHLSAQRDRQQPTSCDILYFLKLFFWASGDSR